MECPKGNRYDLAAWAHLQWLCPPFHLEAPTELAQYLPVASQLSRPGLQQLWCSPAEENSGFPSFGKLLSTRYFTQQTQRILPLIVSRRRGLTWTGFLSVGFKVCSFTPASSSLPFCGALAGTSTSFVDILICFLQTLEKFSAISTASQCGVLGSNPTQHVVDGTCFLRMFVNLSSGGSQAHCQSQVQAQV